jgi:hypothetical protein
MKARLPVIFTSIPEAGGHNPQARRGIPGLTGEHNMLIKAAESPR